MTYASTYGSGNYATTLGTLGGSLGLIDATLASGSKSGYSFVSGAVAFTTTTPATFYVSAIPTGSTGVTATGTRRFGIATDGVIKFDTAALTTQFDATTVAAASALAN